MTVVFWDLQGVTLVYFPKPGEIVIVFMHFTVCVSTNCEIQFVGTGLSCCVLQ
jgi:hypothetical protein